MNPNNFPPPPPEYANYPNLWRVFCVLNSCKNPRAVHNALLALVESGAFAELRNSFFGANAKGVESNGGK